MPGLDFFQAPGPASPALTRSTKRVRQEGAPPGPQNLEKAVQELTRQMHQVCQVVSAHDQSLRELEAWSTRTWIFPSEAELATLLTQSMDKWKQRLPQRGQAHPDGPARLTVAAAVAQWLLKEPGRRQSLALFAELHDPMTELQHLHQSVSLAVTKPIRDGRIILKIRPLQSTLQAWQEAYHCLASIPGVELKDVAPPGPLIRGLRKGQAYGPPAE